MRLISWLMIILLAGCASSSEDTRGAEDIADRAEVIDLTNPAPDQAEIEGAHDDALADDMGAQSVTPYASGSYPATLPKRSYYPLMNGYRVDKSVEVFSLDDWYPPLPRQ